MSGKHPKRKPRPGVDEYGRILLHYAARDGDEAAVTNALDTGSAIDAQDDNGWTPLHFAAQSGNTNVVKELLRRGANANLRNSHGNDALSVGITHARQNLAMFRMLLDAGSNPDQPNHYGRSARDVATAFGIDLTDHTDERT